MNRKQLNVAIETHTGSVLPETAHYVTQYAFVVFAFDRDGVCVFNAKIHSQSDALYRMGIDRFETYIH